MYDSYSTLKKLHSYLLCLKSTSLDSDGGGDGDSCSCIHPVSPRISSLHQDSVTIAHKMVLKTWKRYRKCDDSKCKLHVKWPGAYVVERCVYTNTWHCKSRHLIIYLCFRCIVMSWEDFNVFFEISIKMLTIKRPSLRDYTETDHAFVVLD